MVQKMSRLKYYVLAFIIRGLYDFYNYMITGCVCLESLIEFSFNNISSPKDEKYKDFSEIK